jgi:hypothetical protein
VVRSHITTGLAGRTAAGMQSRSRVVTIRSDPGWRCGLMRFTVNLQLLGDRSRLAVGTRRVEMQYNRRDELRTGD